MNPRRALLGLPFALSLSACAPSAAHFVAGGRYDEAVCAASLFSHDPAADSATVVRAINKNLRPSLHVRAITRQELTDAIGPAGERVNDQVLIVRAVMGVRTSGSLGVRPALELAGSGVRPLPHPTTGPFSERSSGQPVGPTRELLAGLTGESLPTPQHVQTGPSDANKFFSFLGELLTLGIIPVMQITGASEPQRSYYVPPSDQAYLASAPFAEMLYRSLMSISGTVLIFARPRGDDVALRATWSFQSSSYDGTCGVNGTIELPLPPGDSIEDRINRRFGNKVLPVALEP